MLVFSFGNGKIWNSDGDPNYMYFLELLLISWTFPRGGSGRGGLSVVSALKLIDADVFIWCCRDLEF